MPFLLSKFIEITTFATSKMFINQSEELLISYNL